MKKLPLAILTLVAIVFAACGNKTQQATDQDTVKSFEQSQIEASIKMHMDSIVAEMNSKEFAPIVDAANHGTLALTADQKKVKPDYLFDAAKVADLATAQQKYAALAIMKTDMEVARLYDMDTEAYKEASKKLLSELGDAGLQKVLEANCETYSAGNEMLYKEMDAEGRINFYWMLSAAFVVENLYIASQDADYYLAKMTDEQASNMTFRLVCILEALDQLAVYDPEMPGFADGLEPLKALNATSVAELKTQLAEAKEKVAEARASLLQ